MAKRHAKAMVLGLTGVTLAAVAAFCLLSSATGQRRAGPQEAKAEQTQKIPNANATGHVVIGGVKRKASDVQRSPADRSSREKHRKLMERIGRVKPVKATANPHVASVAKALREKKNPERVSAFMRPKKFDRAAYNRDRKKYLETIELGRVFSSAQPAENVPRIAYVGSSRHRIVQGQSVTLKAKVVPGAPVTFTSFDLGAFNGLPSTTVEANRAGIAQATFTGTPGTFNRVSILAASPMTSGRLRYIVHVALPPETPDSEENDAEAEEEEPDEADESNE